MSGRRHTHNGILTRRRSSSRSRKTEALKKVDDANEIIDEINEDNDGSFGILKVEEFVLQQLVFSRCVLLIFQCCINWIMFDWPTDAFKGLQIPTEPLDGVVNFFVGGLANWDSRHFLHIAEFGYTWESELAFYPFFPMIIRIFGSLIHAFIPMISLRYSMILAGVIINNLAFVAAGFVLFHLVFKITRNLKESLIAVYVFCWNPASIFFSSVYTESIYSLITFSGIYILEQQSHSRMNQLYAALIFSLAFMTRSNGFLNIGYIGFAMLIDTVFKRTGDKYQQLAFDRTLLTKIPLKLPLLLFYVFIMILPMRIFSFAIEEKFCHTVANYSNPWLLEYAESESVILPGMLNDLSWCNSNSQKINFISIFMPPYYSTVQERYWSVGFLKYWQIRKIPLFIIASPTLGFVLYGVYKVFNGILYDKRMIHLVLTDRRHLIPYALHSLFLVICGIFVYNVEVSIRLIYSSTPFIYLILAQIMSHQTPKIKVPEDLLEPFALPFLFNYAFVKPIRFLMLAYLLGYFTIGTLMHVNWLPFV